MTRQAIGFLLVLVLCGFAVAETGALRLEWPLAPEGLPDLTFLEAPEVRFGEPEEPEDSGPTPDDLVRRPFSREAVDRLIGDAVRALDGKVAVADDGVRVTGPEAALTLARKRWAAVTRFVTGRATVSVSLFEVAPDPAATDPVKLAEALARSPDRLAWTARLETIRDRTAEREAVTSHPFVLRQEAEVAQYAAIIQPESGVLVTGRRLAVLCRPLSSREAVVTLSLHVASDPESMEPVQLQGGSIQLPQVRFLSVLVGMRLAAGRPEAILLPNPAREGSLAVVVTVDGLAPDADRPDGLVDLVAGAGSAETAIFDGHLRVEDRGLRAEDLSPSVFLLLGDAADAARVAREIASPGDPVALRRERRSLPWTDLVTRPGFDPILGTVPAETGALESRLMAPLGPGTPFRIVHGTWRRILASLDAEIAQAAALVEPVVRDHFEGESLDARRAGDGVAIRRRTRVLLARERRDPGVYKDTEGRRGRETGHHLDLLRVAETASVLRLGTGETTDLRREGERAVVDVFTVAR